MTESSTPRRQFVWGREQGVPPGVKAAGGARLEMGDLAPGVGGQLAINREDSHADTDAGRRRRRDHLHTVKPRRKPMASRIQNGAVSARRNSEIAFHEDVVIVCAGNSTASPAHFNTAARLK